MSENVFIATTDSGVVEIFKVDSGGQWINDLEISPNHEWILLENDMCSDCKYKNTKSKYCKAAIGLYAAVNAFSDISSIDRMSVTIIGSDNSMTNRCLQVQSGLSILFFTCLVFSGCFKFKQFRWAWDFYKLQSDDVGMFYTLFSSFYSKKILSNSCNMSNLNIDEMLNEFKSIYETLKKIYKRVAKASKNDANVNAIVKLISLTQLLQSSFDDYMQLLNKKINE